MKCPKCSAPMNHHASKVIEPRNEAERRSFDADLEGVVLDCHLCPNCGTSVSQFSEPPHSRP